MEQPEYHAWKRAFTAEHGRGPTPYEAWIAGRDALTAKSEPITITTTDGASVDLKAPWGLPS